MTLLIGGLCIDDVIDRSPRRRRPVARRPRPRVRLRARERLRLGRGDGTGGGGRCIPIDRSIGHRSLTTHQPRSVIDYS